MNLLRCAKGHFYDADKNGKVCPYCEESAAQQEKAAEIVSEPVKEESTKPATRVVEEDDNVTVGYYSRVIVLSEWRSNPFQYEDKCL